MFNLRSRFAGRWEHPGTLPTPMLSGCIRCEYPRDGLPASAACPECGAAHDEYTFLVRGGSGPGNGTPGLVLGLLVLAGSVFLSVVAGSSMGCVVALGVIIGVLVTWTGLMLRVQASKGGDVTWAFLPDGLEVRMRGVTTKVPWRLLEELRLRGGWRGWVRVQARAPDLFLGGHPAIWLRDQATIARMLEVAHRRAAAH